MQASRHDEAEQLFRQAQLMAPTDPSVYMFTGKLLSNKKHFSLKNEKQRREKNIY